MLKKLLLISFLSISLVFPVLAQGDKYGTSATQQATGGLLPTSIKGATNVPELIGSIISIILGLLGIVFFGLIFWAGFNWMTAQGNSDKIDRSKETITSAAVGLVVVLAAYALTNFVFESLSNNNAVTNSTTSACTGTCVAPSECSTSGGTEISGACDSGQVCCQ